MEKVTRRISIIKNDLQRNMTLVFVITGVVAILFNYGFSRYMVSEMNKASSLRIASAQAQVLIISLMFVVVVGYFVGLWCSHRLAGPIYRFERTFDMMASGDFSAKVILRKNDFLKDTAEGLNNALHATRETVETDRKRLKEALGILESLDSRVPEDAKADAARAKDLLGSMLESFVISGEDPREPEEVESPRPKVQSPGE